MSMKWTSPTYPNGIVPDEQLIQDAKNLAARAQREGSPYLFVPRWMLEQLIEKATRPHD